MKDELLALKNYEKVKHINKTILLNNFSRLITNTLSQTAYSNALSSLSYYLLQNNFLEQAQEITNLAMIIDPKNIHSYIHLGIIYEKRKLFDKALEILTKAEQINPNVSQIYYNKAVCYYKKMNFKRAKENAEKALHLDPTNLDAQRILTLISQK